MVKHDRIKSGQCVIIVHVSISPYAKIEIRGGRRIILVPCMCMDVQCSEPHYHLAYRLHFNMQF